MCPNRFAVRNLELFRRGFYRRRRELLIARLPVRMPSTPKDGDQGRDQQGAGDQGVEQEADAEGEGDLAEALDRDQGHGGVGEGEDEAGDGDRAAGADAGGADRRTQLLLLSLLPDAADQEDVVVGAQSEEE